MSLFFSATGGDAPELDRGRLRPTVEALATQEAAERLVQVLSLAEGFHFHIVLCETRRLATALALWVHDELSRQAPAGIEILWLSPYEPDPLAPLPAPDTLTPQRLRWTALDHLLGDMERPAGERMVFLDAGGAPAEHGPAWRRLFTALNQGRNAVIRHLQCPLTLVVSPALETDFAHVAPDFWSMRGLTVSLVDATPLESVTTRKPAMEGRRSDETELVMLQRQYRRMRAEYLRRAGRSHTARGLAVLLSRLSRAQRALGRHEAAHRLLSGELLPLVEELGDDQLRAEAYLELADVLAAWGRSREALPVLQDTVVPLCQKLGNERMELDAVGRIADIRVLVGELDEALRLQREVLLPAYERMGDERARAVTLGKIADILATRGQFDEALRIRHEEVPVYERLGDARQRAVAMGHIADIQARRGQPDEALRTRLGTFRAYEQLGDERGGTMALGEMADILQARGQLDEALRIYREKELPVYERLGDEHARAVTLGKIADVLQRRGQLDEAVRIRLEEELPVYERLGDVPNLIRGRIGLARGFLERQGPGDVAEATRLLDLARADAERLGLPESEAVERTQREYDLDREP